MVKTFNLTRRIRDLRASLSDAWENFQENDSIAKIKPYLPPLNFITIHYAYFILTCLITSLIFWGSSSPSRSISYEDSLFLVISAMTEAGLNTVNLSQMTTFQQVILWFLIVIGSAIWVSIGTVLTRKKIFEKRFESVVVSMRERRSASRGGGGKGEGMGREPSVVRMLQETRKAEEPVERHEFESRHSGPRDPTPSSSSKDLALNEQPDLTEERGRERASASSEGTAQTVAANPGKPAVEINEEVNIRSGTGTIDEGVHDRRGSAVSGVGVGGDHITMMKYVPQAPDDHPRVLAFAGVGAHPHSSAYRSPYVRDGLRGRHTTNDPSKAPLGSKSSPDQELDVLQYPHYLTKHTTGRNAQFYGLSREEREHLGGVEYRAITLLAWIVPIYFVMWQALGCLGLAAYFAHNKRSVSEMNGINPWWLGVFNGVSAFNNSGMSLLDANMIPFNQAVYPLITMGVMILAGNTAYPLFLRLILWTMLKVLTILFPDTTVHAPWKATLRFILAYPRRVYTNLFPSAPTWWLLFMTILLNGIDWIAFELLNIHNPAINVIPPGFRALDGLFQALAVRSGGFYVISITSLRIGLQFLYVIMMYISVYPVVITMRHSNVYEERSLGIYAEDDSAPDDIEVGDLPKLNKLGKLRRTLTKFTPFPGASTATPKATAGAQFVRQQIRGQLAHDLWWLVLAILFITCIEVSNFERDPVTYSVFNIAFEVVSGYGCVGISTGLPDQAYSFSGGWKTCSKLILCAVMLRGRHRGLPVALDRAVRLPGGAGDRGRAGWGRGETEEEDFRLRRSMSEGVRRSSVVGAL
ncbi:cation transport protein-domain-containing protein [Tricladium varicosporioides]|nr:cation transport protein-domain-containing protein [Hymenoscyphus varicosporioides]